MLQCHHFAVGECRSCGLLATPYDAQLANKQRQVAALLDPQARWLSPVPSAESGFRNKAKMVVTGTAARPRLGILGPAPDTAGVDLSDCPLHVPDIEQAFGVLAEFIGRADLAPYDVAGRSGELKLLLLTQAPGTGELMVRFVLRSQEAVARIRKHLPWLLDQLPLARVVSVNLQPEHKAVLEGEREIILTTDEALCVRINDVDLRLRPQSFFQTNTAVAAALYRQARDWAAVLAPTTVWDLYCGVGGFAFHLAGPGRSVTGVEISAEAVASAQQVAASAPYPVRFVVGDATDLLEGPLPDLIVVNPPRRGIGAVLAAQLESADVDHLIYSSCNADSLARDLAAMPSWRAREARVFDMFPHTGHFETLVLLERR